MPRVAIEVPQAVGPAGDPGQFAAGQAGALQVERRAQHVAQGDGGGARGGEGGEHPGVGQGPARQRRGQHAEVLGLLGHRAGLGRAGALHPADALGSQRVLDPVEGMPRGLARRDEQRAQVASAHGAPVAEGPAGPGGADRVDQRAEVTERDPGVRGALERQHGQRGEHRRDRDPDQQQRDRGGGAPGQRRLPGGAAPGPAAAQRGRGSGPVGAQRGLAVAHPGRGHDDDPLAGQLGAPAQVEGGGRLRQRRADTADPREDRATHEQAGQAHGQDVGAGVELALVGLPRPGAGDPAAGAGDQLADLDQRPGVVPADQFGAGQAHRGRAPNRADQVVQGVRGGGGVVQQEPDPLGVGVVRRGLEIGQHPVDGRRDGRRPDPDHPLVGDHLGQPLVPGDRLDVAAAELDDDQALGCVDLGGDGVEGVGEPGRVGADDEQGGDHRHAGGGDPGGVGGRVGHRRAGGGVRCGQRGHLGGWGRRAAAAGAAVGLRRPAS